MESDRMAFFRKILDERLETLLKGAGVAIGEMFRQRESPADALDIATLESNRDFSLRLQDRERRLVAKLKQALQRIEDEEYGVCAGCGEEISERRLLARPVATHCIDCKTEAEQMERHRHVF